jgi:aldehyde dehydrogenase (NAD+)
MRFSSDDEVVAKANDSRFGLGAYIHTNDLSRAHNVAAGLHAGAVAVNGMLPMSANQPFGGYKESGFGREGGRHGLEEFLQIKQVLLHL